MKREVRKFAASVLGAAAVVGLLAFAGCSGEKGGEKSAGQTAGQTAEKKELTKFNVGYLASTGHILYFIAQEKGIFKEEGLDVTLFQFNNSGEGINAIIAGRLDAGSFGTAPPFTFIDKGQQISIFGGQMYEGHALVAKPENAAAFSDLSGFKGKKIATIRLSTGDIVFRFGLAQAGIDIKKDLTINEFESPAAALEAVKKGAADAGVVWSPFRKMSEQQGLAIVQYSGNIPNMKNHPCCRQIAVTENLKKSPEAYRSFLAALIRAYDVYKSDHEESLKHLAKYVQVDREILEAETYGRHIGSNPDPDKINVIQFWDAMKTAGYITSDTDISQHINTELYDAALKDIISRYPNNKNYEELKSIFKQG